MHFDHLIKLLEKITNTLICLLTKCVKVTQSHEDKSATKLLHEGNAVYEGNFHGISAQALHSQSSMLKT